MNIEPYASSHADAVAKLSLRAWSPVFDACASADFKTWVAIEHGAVAGFVAIRFHDGKLGEIYMIAVDPDYQRRGIAMALTDFAVDRMKEAGMAIAMVETGGDWGHAPARAAYEKAGFRVLPLARYFKKL
jgi:ribosomal protein S18 acetylase RimI-like enzyme